MKPDQFGKILFEFIILHSGWESDEKGYIIETETGKREIILSSHGVFYIASVTELMDKIAEYRQVISETEKALLFITS